MKKLELIRNIMDVKVDAFREINHYTIQAMYDEIERKGGISQLNKELRTRYNIEKR